MRLLGRDEAEPLVVRVLEGFDDAGPVGEIDLERGIGAFVSEMHLADRGHLAGGDSLARHLVARVGFELGHHAVELTHQPVVERRLDGAFAHHAQIGQPHAVGRQHAGEGVDEHPCHAERIGDQTGVLPARAAEAVEDIFGDVVAALDRDLLDGVGHVLDRDLQEPVGHLDHAPRIPRRRLDLGGEGRELLPHDIAVQPLLAARAEHGGEETGLDLAHHHIGIGDA